MAAVDLSPTPAWRWRLLRRTPLSLRSLADDGLAVRLTDGVWALTPQGVA